MSLANQSALFQGVLRPDYVPYYSLQENWSKKIGQPTSKSAEIEKRLKEFQERPSFGHEPTFGIFQPLLNPFHPKYKPAFRYVRPTSIESKTSKDEPQQSHGISHQVAYGTNQYQQQQRQHQHQHQHHQNEHHHHHPHRDETPHNMFPPPMPNPYEAYSSAPVAPYSSIAEENVTAPPIFSDPPQNNVGGFGMSAFASYPIEPVQMDVIPEYSNHEDAPQVKGSENSLSPELYAFLRSNGKPTSFDDIFLDCGIRNLTNEDIAIMENYQKEILTNRVTIYDENDCIRLLLLGLCITVDSSLKSPQVFYIGHDRAKLERFCLMVGFYQPRTSITPSLASDESTNLGESSIIFTHWNDIDKRCLNYLDDIKLVILDDGDTFVRECPHGSDDYDAFVVLRTDVLRHALFVVFSSPNPSAKVAQFMTELNT